MAGLLTVAPPGSMVIDLGKRKKKADLTPDLHTVASWNASMDGLKHPKGGDGRWVDRAGLIDAVRSIAGVDHWGKMQSAHMAKTGVHDWSDEELASVAGHAEVFARKLQSEIEARRTARETPITNREAEMKAFEEKGFEAFSSVDLARYKVLGGTLAEPEAPSRFENASQKRERARDLLSNSSGSPEDQLERRRWAESLTREADQMDAATRAPKASPGKPLRAAKVKAPVKPIPAELAARIEAARARPMRSDIAYLEKELPKLTIAQLEALAVEGEHWKDTPLPGGNKKQKVSFTLDRIVGKLQHEMVTHQGSAKGSDYDNEYRRRLKLADERGDRAEYAALVAGFGSGGTGPGLPPEKTVAPKQDFGVGSDPWGTPEARAQEARLRETGIIPEKLEDVIVGNAGAEMHARNKAKAEAAKPLRAKKVKPAKEGNNLEAIRNLSPAAFGSEDQRLNAIASIVANPQAGDAERLKSWLESLKLPELKAAADKHGVKLIGRTKAEKIDSFVASTVQNKLNSQAIRGGVLDAPAPGTLAAKQADGKGLKTLQDKVARLAVALDVENRKRSKTSRIQSSKESRLRHQLTEARRELAAKEKASGFAPGVLADDRAEAMDDALIAAGNPFSGPTHLDTPRRTSGDGMFFGDHYHGDGRIGAVIEDLSPDQARINVGGKRLDDALADVIIEGHRGELGATNRQIEKWRTISDQVRPIDADAASRIDRALARFKMPTVPYLSDQALADAPEPLRVLRGRIGSIPETGQGGGELKRLSEIIEGWSKGEIRALELDRRVQSLTDMRHESQEGRFEIAKAVEQALRELEAMKAELRQKQNEIRARG